MVRTAKPTSTPLYNRQDTQREERKGKEKTHPEGLGLFILPQLLTQYLQMRSCSLCGEVSIKEVGEAHPEFGLVKGGVQEPKGPQPGGRTS